MAERHHELPALQTTCLWRRAPSSVLSSLPHSGNPGTQQAGPKTFCVSVRPGMRWKNHLAGLNGREGDGSQLGSVDKRQTRSWIPWVQIPLCLQAGAKPCVLKSPPGKMATGWEDSPQCRWKCPGLSLAPTEQGCISEPAQRPSPALSTVHGLARSSPRGGACPLATAHECGHRGSTEHVSISASNKTQSVSPS